MDTKFHVGVVISCMICLILGQVNLGSYGTPSHFPPYKQDRFLPSRALDPPKSSSFEYYPDTCTHSGDWPNITFGYWMIEFPEQVFITTVELYYREYFEYRMDGITLSISDDPDNLAPGDICYKDVTDGNATLHQIFPCNRIGKYLMFSKNRSDNQGRELIIELCYVEILGCRVGYFGTNCTQSCSTNCQGPCEPKNGECVSGCKEGWQGPKCEQECNSGSFGAGCSQTCAGCLLNNCHHVSGECTDTTGCNPGYIYSTKCDKKCDSGSFGVGCSGKCDGCVVNDCHHITGECMDITRCNPGYIYSRKCDQKCDSGSFGADCSETCNGCVADDCHYITGECSDTSRCKPGYYYNKKCNQSCHAGYFGDKCNQLCPENCYGPCEIRYGECVSGCIDGWQGSTCEQGIRCTNLPTIDNAIDLDRSIPHRYPDTVEVQCERGFIRNGSSTINCMTNRQWNVTLHCAAVQCAINIDEKLVVSPYKPAYHFGDRISFGCSYPFVLSSSGEGIECEAGDNDTGKWTKELPACIETPTLDQSGMVGVTGGLSTVILIMICVNVFLLWRLRRGKQGRSQKEGSPTTSNVKTYDDLNVEMREQQNVYSEIDKVGVQSS